MEKTLVPNNVTLAGLRRLLREARKKVEAGEAVCIDLRLWDYGNLVEEAGRIAEAIGVYRSASEEGTSYFTTLGKAHEYVEEWRKEETNDATKRSTS